LLHFLFSPICSDAFADINFLGKKIPDIFVSAPEKDTSYFILVEKNSQTLYLYSYDGSSYEQILNTRCSTGKVKGAKVFQGDQKTPEGIYFFDHKYEAKQLAAIYGDGAFSMDFPNSLDRFLQIGGSSIWLHGANKEIKPRDSNGCVVVDNNILDKLKKYITLKDTPIIVVDEINYIRENSYKKEAKEIVFLISETNKAIENRTYQNYLSFYSPDFLPDITWWSEWVSYRKNLKKDEILNSVQQDNILILKHKDFYIAVFDKYIKLENGGERIYTGKEKKFIKFDGKKPIIISEESLEIAKSSTETKKGPALITAYKKLIRKTSQQTEMAEVKERINFWLEAWSAKDINSYAKCYSEKFRFGDMNRKAWLENKQKINNQYKFIQVTAENIKSAIKNNQCIVTFMQKYKSDAYQAKGIKTITLIRENNEWKIYREGWRKL
jgi:murein L,D-transpeptidase YafK